VKREHDSIAGRQIWIATEDYPPKLGGLARWSENTARALSDRGARVTVLAKKADPARHRDAAWTVVGVTGPDFPRWRRFHFRRTGRGVQRTGNAPDLIIASTWHVGEAFAGRRPRVPLTIAIHGLEVFRPWPAGRRRRMAKTLSAADRLVAASAYTAGRVREIVPGRDIAVGLNGIDREVFAPPGRLLPPDRDLQLLSVGRLVERKRFDLVLEVVAASTERGLDVGLWIIGRGPLEPDLRARAAERGIDARVRFLGARTDRELAVYYRSADLFVSPCQSDPATGDVEGFGLTFVEAAACGTPAVALAEGGVTDAVEDGLSGLLTTRDDFVARTLELLGDRPRINRLSEQAAERARRFDIRRVVTNLLPEGF